MTFSSGGLIQRADYNQLAYGSNDGTLNTSTANVGLMWATGTRRYGYGQSLATIPALQVGDTVRASQWNNLDNILTAIRQHQSGPGAYGYPGPVVGGQSMTARTYYATSIPAGYANGIG